MGALALIRCERDYDAVDAEPGIRWRCLTFYQVGGDCLASLLQVAPYGDEPYYATVIIADDVSDGLDIEQALFLIEALKQAVQVEERTRKYWDK